MATGVGYSNRSLLEFSLKGTQQSPLILPELISPALIANGRATTLLKPSTGNVGQLKSVLRIDDRNIKAMNRVKQLLFSETESSIA